MWPHDTRSGVHLLYGANGTGVLASMSKDAEKDRDHLFKVPKQRTRNPKQLYTIPSSFRIFIPAQLKKRDLSFDKQVMPPTFRSERDDSHNSMIQIDGFYTPDNLIQELKKDDAKKKSERGFDPTFGSLVATTVSYVYRLNSKAPLRILVTTAGEGGETVCVTLLQRRKMVNSTLETSTAPELGATQSLKFDSRVKQVLFPSSIIPFQKEVNCNILAIRTSYDIHIIRVLIMNDFYLRVERIADIPGSNISSFPLADITFNPQDWNYISVVDVKGNFSMFKLLKHPIPLSPGYQQVEFPFTTIYDPVELSNFKKVFWGSDNKSLYIMSRSAIHKLNTKTKKLKCKVIANAWTKLVDIARAPEAAEEFCFLLSTKEVTLVDTSRGFKNILSWKHNLDEKDFTLKLNIISLQFMKDHDSHERRNGFLCLITSQVRNFTYVVEFSINGSTPYMVNNPYFYLPHPSRAIHSAVMFPISLIKESVAFACYQATADLELSIMVMKLDSRDPFLAPLSNNTLFLEKELALNSNIANSVDKNNNIMQDKDETSLQKSKPQDLYDKLINFHTKDLDINSYGSQVTNLEGDKVQSFADELGEFLNQAIKSGITPYSLLLSKDHRAPYLHNPIEMQSMVGQLMQYYTSFPRKKLKFVHSAGRVFSDIAKAAEEFEAYEQMNIFEEFFTFFQKLEPMNSSDVKLSSWISINLALSVITMNEEGDETVVQKGFGDEEFKPNLSLELNEMVDSWSDEEELDDRAGAQTGFNETTESIAESQLRLSTPTVSLSQPRATSTQSQASKRRRLHYSGFASSTPPLGLSTQLATKSTVESASSASQMVTRHLTPMSQSSQASLSGGSQLASSQATGRTVIKKKKKMSGFA